MFTRDIDMCTEGLLIEKYLYKILDFESFVLDKGLPANSELLLIEDYIYKNFKKKFYTLISNFVSQCFIENKDEVIIRYIKTIIRDSRGQVYYAYKRLKIMYKLLGGKDKSKLYNIIKI